AFPQYYVSWWLGAYLADRDAQGKPLPWWSLLAPVVLLPAGCVLVSEHQAFAGFICWAGGFAPILSWIVTRQSPALTRATPLHWLGNFSYSIYAFHLPIVVLASLLLLPTGKSNSINGSLLVAFVTGIACYALYFIAERPSILILRKI